MCSCCGGPVVHFSPCFGSYFDVPEVTCRGLQLSGLWEGIPSPTVRHPLGVHITSCLSMQVFCCGLGAGTHSDDLEQKERRKWEILSRTGSEGCLTVIIFDGIIIAQSNPTPGSYIPSLLPVRSPLSLSPWYEWNWQSDFREPSLNFVWGVFIIPRVSLSG